MMIRFLWTAAICVSLMVSPALAEGYSARTHYYAIEYLKPHEGAGEVSILNITFNRQIDAETAESILREELQRAISLFPSKGEVLAYAWTETSPGPGSEKRIALSDGSGYLTYIPKTKQTLTEKQFDLSKQKHPEAGKDLSIEISLQLERGADGRARVLGNTNLPHGMQLMLDLRGIDSKYFAQDKIEVVNGHFVSLWFSDGGKPIRSGPYGITLSSPLPSLQSAAVRLVIGQNGENLVGPVSTWRGSKMVKYSTQINLK